MSADNPRNLRQWFAHQGPFKGAFRVRSGYLKYISAYAEIQ